MTWLVAAFWLAAGSSFCDAPADAPITSDALAAFAPEVASQVTALLATDAAVTEAAAKAVSAARLLGCTDTHDGPRAAWRARAVDVLKDARFSGTRAGDDVISRLIERVIVSIGAMFESRGMQSYAGNVRVVYLALLCVAAIAGVFQLVRMRRRQPTPRAVVAGTAVNTRVSHVRDFHMLRKHADLALARGDAHGAVMCAADALKELLCAAQADSTAMTMRELARSRGIVGVAVAPLASFERVAYARRCTRPDALAFLAEVDAYVASLGAS